MCIEKYFKGYLCNEDILKCKASSNGNDNPLVYLFAQEIKDSSTLLDIRNIMLFPLLAALKNMILTG